MSVNVDLYYSHELKVFSIEVSTDKDEPSQALMLDQTNLLEFVATMRMITSDVLERIK